MAPRASPEQPPAPDPHFGLTPFFEAARLARADIAVLRVLLRFDPARPWRWRALEVSAKALVFLGAHLRLAGALWRERGREMVLVREFATQLLCAVWPLIWPLRRRVFFLINHNLQEAHQRPLERAMLRFLARTGCRFACFEVPAGFRDIGLELGPERLLVLPHPVGRLAAPRAARSGAPVVGVIGEMRAEKGSEAILHALAALRAEGRLDVRLLLGGPEAHRLEAWRERGFEVVGTERPEDYVGALDICDVVVLNYRRERYLHRPSGVAADAITRGAAVVCPDFPLMRHQLTHPVQVGATFAALDELGPAISRALTLRADFEARRAAHARERAAPALARILDAHVAAHLARGPRGQTA